MISTMKSRTSLLNSSMFQATCAFIVGYLLSTELLRQFTCPGKHRINERGDDGAFDVRKDGGGDDGVMVGVHVEVLRVNLTTEASTNWFDEVQMDGVTTMEDVPNHKSSDNNNRVKIACFILHGSAQPARAVLTSWIPLCDVNVTLDIRRPFPGSKDNSSFLEEMSKVKVTSVDRLDYYLLAPHDSYIVMDNLKEYLSHRDPVQPHAYGHAMVRELGKSGVPLYTVGGTLVVSREALLRVVSIGECATNKIPDTTKILACLHESGGNLVDTRDQFARNTFLAPAKPFQILTGSLDDKFVREQKFSTNHCESSTCLSDFPIALHKLSSNEIHLVHFLIDWSNYSHFTGANKHFKLRLKFNGSKLPVAPLVTSAGAAVLF